MFTFQNALNGAINNWIASQSPRPATLAELVERARDLDRYWRMYAKPLDSQGNLHTRELSVKNSYTEINATQPSIYEPPVRRAKLTKEPRQYHIDNHLCFYCRQEGHSIFGCNHPDKKSPRQPMIRQVFPIEEDDDEMDPYEGSSFPTSPL